MEHTELVTRARQNRSSGAVLKIKVSNIRSRNRTAVIAIVEGVTDVGPYEVWIDRINDELAIEFVPASGKSQVLDFRRRMQGDCSGLAIGIYMFVDRDFDGLRGQAAGNDIFCTRAYSIENYFVSEAILKSILTDELRCTAETDHRDRIVKLFRRVLNEFNDCMEQANRRIFRARLLGIRGPGIEEKITRYVDISPHEVRRNYDELGLRKLIALEREPTRREIDDIDSKFDALDPSLDYRGKYLLRFFLGWLEKLSDERTRCGQTLLPDAGNVKFSVTVLTLRSLATRAPVPDGLEQFVRRMKLP